MSMQQVAFWLLTGVASCLADTPLHTDAGRAACGSAAGAPSVSSESFRASAARFERFWSLSDYQRLLAGAERGAAATGEPLGLRHVLFVVKASRARAEMALRMEQVWLHATSNRIYLVDDLIDGLPESLQVVMNSGKASDGAQGGRPDPVATSRLFIWLHQAKVGYDVGGLSEDTRWVVLLGDDVFVNLARLYYFLVRYPAEDHPVMFGHVLSDAEVYDFDMPCLESGAAILNKRAVELLGRSASCRECPYVGSDAISMGFCAFFSAVPLVHVSAIHCHAQYTGEEDRLLTGDMVAHHWIAAGGLSLSAAGAAAAAVELTERLPYHPFEADFPNFECRTPAGVHWTVQELAEKVAFCSSATSDPPAGTQVGPSKILIDEDELSSSSVAMRDNSTSPSGWPESLLKEVLYGENPHDERGFYAALGSALASGLTDASGWSSSWHFLRSAGTWLHRAETSRFLAALRASGVLDLQGGAKALFAFVNPATTMLEPGGGFLLSAGALQVLVQSPGRTSWPLSSGALRALGITVVHAPQMVPDAAALPRGLRGVVSAGAVSGAWSIGQVKNDDAMDELEALMQERRFFIDLVSENFADWAVSKSCESSNLDKDSWMRFLHDDDEHIKVVRGFQGGRREFRTLHAMYRSETSYVLPFHGINPDTVLVARDCSQQSQ